MPHLPEAMFKTMMASHALVWVVAPNAWSDPALAKTQECPRLDLIPNNLNSAHMLHLAVTRNLERVRFPQELLPPPFVPKNAFILTSSWDIGRVFRWQVYMGSHVVAEAREARKAPTNEATVSHLVETSCAVEFPSKVWDFIVNPQCTFFRSYQGPHT
jgi:hypothetical protein